MVKEIPLQNGMVALVDDEDFERVNRHVWSLSVANDNGTLLVRRKGMQLTRYIMNLNDNDEQIVTFKDKNQLNFQKDNLVLTDKKNIVRNARGRRNTSSKYKGVSWDGSRNKWTAQIGLDGKGKYLGRYATEDEAALAYNNAVDKFWGGNGFKNVIGANSSATTHEVEGVRMHRKKIGKSGYRGVWKEWNKWAVYINNKFVASYNSPEQAAKAYDQKAIELYGDKAILNFPKETTLKIGGNQNE